MQARPRATFHLTAALRFLSAENISQPCPFWNAIRRGAAVLSAPPLRIWECGWYRTKSPDTGLPHHHARIRPSDNGIERACETVERTVKFGICRDEWRGKQDVITNPAITRARHRIARKTFGKGGFFDLACQPT